MECAVSRLIVSLAQPGTTQRKVIVPFYISLLDTFLDTFLGEGKSRERADFRAVSLFVGQQEIGAPSCPYAVSARHGHLPPPALFVFLHGQ
jgi:hypothetical protein